MKVNKYGIICALALLSGVVGCEDSSSLLDKEESNDIYANMVFSDPYNATWFLSNIYKSMNDGFMVFGSDDSGGFLGNAVDEGIWKANWDNAYKMSVGAWATTDMLLNYDPWKKYYTAIRAACRFLEHADEIPDSPEPFIDEGVRTRMKGEARFLRALFYYELLKFYGGVPIVTRVLGPDDAAELHGARAGFDEVVEFICSEAMLAAGDLPHVDEYADSEWGRATKGACYALISRVRLLAASPLFNDRQNPSGSACRGEYSAEKWKTAAEAAKYFLENTRGYALHRSTDPERYGDYEDLFLRRYSPEIILAYQQDQFAVRLERNCLPGQLFNYAFGVLNNFPTLNTVAEYESSDSTTKATWFRPTCSVSTSCSNSTRPTEPIPKAASIPRIPMSTATRVSTSRSGTTANRGQHGARRPPIRPNSNRMSAAPTTPRPRASTARASSTASSSTHGQTSPGTARC